MEHDNRAQELRRQDPRPWVGVGASRHDTPVDGENGGHTVFRRLDSIAPGGTRTDFDQRQTVGDPVPDSHLEDQPQIGGD